MSNIWSDDFMSKLNELSTKTELAEEILNVSLNYFVLHYSNAFYFYVLY